MRYDIRVLRAMLRLAHGRLGANLERIGARSGGARARLRTALRRLERDGLVERVRDGDPRLTMGGLAVAVASLPTAAARAARPGVARRHAA